MNARRKAEEQLVKAHWKRYRSYESVTPVSALARTVGTASVRIGWALLDVSDAIREAGHSIAESNERS
jgi:hypothetical protein